MSARCPSRAMICPRNAMGIPEIIIVDWSSPFLPACIRALECECELGQVVHLITNQPGVADAIACKRVALRATALTENLGFARANNQAVLECRSEWVILLNPDAIVRPGWHRAITAAMDSADASTACIGSLQLTGPDDSIIDGVGDSYHVSGIARRVRHGSAVAGVDVAAAAGSAFTACAAAVAYRRSSFLEAGGFDESFFCYMEDVDLGFRLALRGQRTIIATDAVVHHVGGASSGGGRSEFALYHGHRNLVWTYVKNMPGVALPLTMPLHAAMNALAVAWHAMRGQGGPVTRAKIDAIRGLAAAWQARSTVQAARSVDTWELVRRMLVLPRR